LIYNKYLLTATYWHRYIYSGMLMKKLSSLVGGEAYGFRWT